MSQPLDELYLVWLYSNIGNPDLKSPRRTFWKLARELFTTEFVWFVPNDDSRADDGRELRLEFMLDCEIPEVDPDWMGMGCSYLEMLIGLSRRLAFETDSNPKDWFWHLMQNLGLHEYNDATKFSPKDIEEVTERLTFRTYDADGQGGLFPLRNPDRDQTKVELWYQLGAYVIEHS